MILDAGEDDDFEAVGELVLGRRVERDVRQAAADLVLGDRRRVLIDLVGELLGRGAAILAVVLDSKVLVNTTRVVGRGQDEAADRCCAAGRVTRADHRRHGRGREQTACAAPDARDACGRGHLDDDLDGRRVEVPTVAGDAECAALDGHTLRHEGVEDGLHEVLQVALAHEGARLLAQARGARLLAGDRLRNNGRHLHGYLGEEVFAWQQTGGSGRGACERVAHASARIKCGRHRQDGCGECFVSRRLEMGTDEFERVCGASFEGRRHCVGNSALKIVLGEVGSRRFLRHVSPVHTKGCILCEGERQLGLRAVCASGARCAQVDRAGTGVADAAWRTWRGGRCRPRRSGKQEVTAYCAPWHVSGDSLCEQGVHSKKIPLSLPVTSYYMVHPHLFMTTKEKSWQDLSSSVSVPWSVAIVGLGLGPQHCRCDRGGT